MCWAQVHKSKGAHLESAAISSRHRILWRALPGYGHLPVMSRLHKLKTLLGTILGADVIYLQAFTKTILLATCNYQNTLPQTAVWAELSLVQCMSSEGQALPACNACMQLRTGIILLCQNSLAGHYAACPEAVSRENRCSTLSQRLAWGSRLAAAK